MTWGIVGAVLALVGLAVLLWRERSKRAAAERNTEKLDAAVRDKSARLVKLGTVAKSKEKRIKELEERLASKDPGALFDDTFGVRGDSKGSRRSD